MASLPPQCDATKQETHLSTAGMTCWHRQCTHGLGHAGAHKSADGGEWERADVPLTPTTTPEDEACAQCERFARAALDAHDYVLAAIWCRVAAYMRKGTI